MSSTDLDWLIIRPGTLLNEPGTGSVFAGTALTYGSVPREDVAAFVAAGLFETSLNRTAVELTTGDRPIAEAVTHLLPRPWQP